ncbi:MAG: bifunctional acetaldehyde-CoA/alcohol dehydrogenase [Cyanobacterium sp. T60_A2020_053]|nr:bifunctional acetaldehyde-CoA/alcohol dehydrogenase [Cyanobacterium sp. T60_A2020_053]
MSETNQNLANLETLISEVKEAQKIYANFTQEQVDRIFKRAALAANDARILLAKMACSETAMGIIEDKVIKNHFASEIIYNKYRDEKTCGIIEKDDFYGIEKVAEPIGIIAGIIPTTNPTSTAIFKTLLALKTRNAIILSPHPRAKKCTIEAAKIVLDAAVAAGAPPHIISWIAEPTLAVSQALMQHPDIKLVLATGGPGMVKAAYSSGHPSLGVGAGNTPAFVASSADVKMAVSSVMISKTFDNGTICASEQSVIVDQSIYDEFRTEFAVRGAYFVTGEETEKLRQVVLKDGHLNADIVGQSVLKIAELANIIIPPETKLLIAEIEKIGFDEPLSYEKLSPILAMYRAENFEDGTNKAAQLVEFGGRGHTSVIYIAQDDHEKIEYFEERMQTSRVLVNTPSSMGAIGDLYNFRLDPSLTLGCGSWGGNSVSGNVGVSHLLNIKTITERRENMLWFRVPPKVYFKYGCLPVALGDLKGKHRAFIVTDHPLYNLGVTNKIESVLEQLGIKFDVFYDVEPDPSLATVNRGLELMKSFNPDVIIAIGGGSPMDAAKIMWLLYEHPDIEFEGIATRFMDIRKRVYDLPPLGEKAIMVAIPTTSGTGSEVTPFAVVTDERTGAKYPLADYALTPNIAIVDPELVLHMPKSLTAFGGVDALTHALESYVSAYATEFTSGLSLKAIGLIFDYLLRAYENGAKDIKAREKVHYAATIAGMAFANAFLGALDALAEEAFDDQCTGSNPRYPLIKDMKDLYTTAYFGA